MKYLPFTNQIDVIKLLMAKQTCTVLIFLLMPIIAFSQNMVIRGNVDSIPDVNIWLYGTEYGTSSDKNGEFSFTFPGTDKPLLLQFTKIGYADTVIQSFSSFNYQDTTYLKVSLKKIAYNIEEVNISSGQYFYNAPNATINDINFNKSGIITVLITKQKKSEIILLDDFGEIITSLLLETKYDSVFYDCFENIELIGKDSCLQIFFNTQDKVLKKVDVFSKNTFNNKLKPCVLHAGCKYVLANHIPDGYSTYVDAFHNKKIGFYVIDICDSLKMKNGFKTFFDNKAFGVSSSIYRQIIALYYQLTPESDNIIANNLWNGNILKLLVQSDAIQEQQKPKGIRKQRELYELIYRYLLLDSEPIDVTYLMSIVK
ncbi:MAG: hypothetical protein WC341_01630 [Bacteroidales bacterium]|jgi:hypothetical protein